MNFVNYELLQRIRRVATYRVIGILSLIDFLSDARNWKDLGRLLYEISKYNIYCIYYKNVKYNI